MFLYSCIAWLFSVLLYTFAEELWEQDLSSDMKIGISTTGYQRVDLRCGVDAFLVNVTLDNDFEGVVYTRGSFRKRKGPCFKKHSQHEDLDDNKLSISMKIPFDDCQTLMDVAESRYTNTLVVQHDTELIMPGDAAFSLDCAFVPEFKLNSDMTSELPFKSKITLVDADPAAATASKQNLTVHSDTENVSFLPPSSLKDEL